MFIATTATSTLRYFITIIPVPETPAGNFYDSTWTPWKEPQEESLDDRHNPHAWAAWFREFLQELLGRRRQVIAKAQAVKLTFMLNKPRARSWLQFREWKLKTWKQRFAV